MTLLSGACNGPWSAIILLYDSIPRRRGYYYVILLCITCMLLLLLCFYVIIVDLQTHQRHYYNSVKCDQIEFRLRITFGKRAVIKTVHALCWWYFRDLHDVYVIKLNVVFLSMPLQHQLYMCVPVCANILVNRAIYCFSFHVRILIPQKA